MIPSFSSYLRRKKPVLKQLISLLGNKFAYVSILGTDVSGESVVVDKDSTVVQPSGLTESGFVIKVFNGYVYSEYSINDIEEKDLETLVTEITRLSRSPRTIENVKVGVMADEPLEKKFNRKIKGEVYSVDYLIHSFKDMVNRTLGSSPLLVNARVSLESSYVSKLFLSKKRDLEQFYPWFNPRSFVLARQGDITKYAYDGYGDASMEVAVNKLEQSLESTARLAIELLDAVAPTPGYYDVITDPSITGLIAHEAFGHGVEMDMYVRHRAKSQSYWHKKVASPLISMHDGADAALSAASYFFDDEGVLAHDTEIIHNGQLINGISDALSALQLSTKPTGNSRRESYKRKAYTRMTNTYFSKGNDKLADMIKSISHGYLLCDTNNGMEDPKNWQIQCTAHYGREIVNGEFTGKIISPVVMSGSVVDLLESISMVSSDFEVIGSGSCGKGYKEWVRVSDGGPYLKAKVKIG
jgi:TldD protein